MAVLGPGDFIVTWGGPNGRGIKFRRFNALGQPLSDTLTVYDEPIDSAFSPDVAADPAGGFILCWSVQTSAFRVLAQRFDSFGAPRAGALVVSPESGGRKDDPRIAVDPVSGRFMVTWIDERETENPDVWARRLTASGQPLGPELLVDTDKGGEALGAVPVFHDDGFSVVWSNFNVSRLEILAQRFDAAGSREGGAVLLSQEQGFYAPSAPAVAVAPSGGLLVLWAGVDQLGPDAGVRARLFDGSLAARGAAVRGEHLHAVEPDRAERGGGSRRQLHGGLEQRRGPALPDHSAGRRVPGTGRQLLRRLRPALLAHRLRGGRQHSLSQQQPLRGAGDLEKPLLRRDRRRSQPPAGRRHRGALVLRSGEPGADDQGARRARGQRPLLGLLRRAVERRIHDHRHRHPDRGGEDATTTPPSSSPAGRTSRPSRRRLPRAWRRRPCRRRSRRLRPRRRAPACPPPRRSAWRPAASPSRWSGPIPGIGLAAQARALPITADTGVFWFVDATNLELMIKVLDGRGVNGKFWVYYGALSDLEYTITVTDTETGQRRMYHNARNNLASQADVDAF